MTHQRVAGPADSSVVVARIGISCAAACGIMTESGENPRLRLKPLLAAYIVATAGPAHAITYPVKDAKTAISIARKVSAGKVSPTAKWHAVLTSGNGGALWFVTTPDKAPPMRGVERSFQRPTGVTVEGHGSAAWIAVSEPHPYRCDLNVYYIYSDTPENGRASPPAPGVVIPAQSRPR